MYPSSIPDYNLFRFIAEPVNRQDLIALAILMPSEYRKFFIGTFTTLLDVSSWQDANGVSAETMVDIGNNDVIFAEFCEFVVDCILTDADVQNAISTVAAANDIGQIGEPPDDPDAPINAPSYNPQCSLDILWAQCLQLVNRVNTNILEFSNRVEVSTNAVELVGDVLASVPGFTLAYKGIGADGWLSLVNYYQEAASEQYSAQATQTYLEDLACEIFCACQADCEITPERLFDIMATRTSSYITQPVSTLQDVIQVAGGLSVSSSIVADATFWLAFGSLRLGSIVLPSIVGSSLDLIMRLAVNDANNDWSILCNCPPPSYSIFRLDGSGNAGMSPSSNETFYQSSFDRYRAEDTDGLASLRGRVEFDFGQTLNVSSVTYRMQYRCTRNTSGDYLRLRDLGNTTTLKNDGVSVGINDVTITWTPASPTALDGLLFFGVIAGQGTGDPNIYWNLVSVEVVVN